MSLIALAGKDNLPDLQFLDKDTLRWITNNKPSFTDLGYEGGFVEFCKNKTRKFSPPKTWFLRTDGIDSIHGIRHILRVVADVSYLAKEKNISDGRIINNALIAASLHDLRRSSDRDDDGHADRAANWFCTNKNLVFNHYEIESINIDTDVVFLAILFHEQPYETIRDDPRYQKNKIVVDLVKSGDALDRYRLPKLKWWINDSYLSIIPSDKAKLFAYRLTLESEAAFLKKRDSVYAIAKALNKLKQ